MQLFICSTDKVHIFNNISCTKPICLRCGLYEIKTRSHTEETERIIHKKQKTDFDGGPHWFLN